MIFNLVVFGALAAYMWNAPDRFMAGMFFTLATYPVVQWAVDKCFDKMGWKRLQRNHW